MSDYYDEDGNRLGRWESCDEETYIAAIVNLGDEASVFASRTRMGERIEDAVDGTPRYADQHIYTEWGKRGLDTPLVCCDDRWDHFGERSHTHALFVHFGASQVTP